MAKSEKAIVVFIGALLLLFLIAMGGVVYTAYKNSQPISGIVKEKIYQPPFVSTTYIRIGEILTPISTQGEPFYGLRIVNEKTQKTELRWVKKEKYDNVKVGDYVSIGKEN